MEALGQVLPPLLSRYRGSHCVAGHAVPATRGRSSARRLGGFLCPSSTGGFPCGLAALLGRHLGGPSLCRPFRPPSVPARLRRGSCLGSDVVAASSSPVASSTMLAASLLRSAGLRDRLGIDPSYRRLRRPEIQTDPLPRSCPGQAAKLVLQQLTELATVSIS